jgi:hypothetical protein
MASFNLNGIQNGFDSRRSSTLRHCGITLAGDVLSGAGAPSAPFWGRRESCIDYCRRMRAAAFGCSAGTCRDVWMGNGSSWCGRVGAIVALAGGIFGCDTSSGGVAAITAPIDAGEGAVQAAVLGDAGDVSAGECVPGQARACQVDRLCSGQQVCTPRGLFGACDCGTSALIGSGIVGARCDVDGDCAGGASCLPATSDEYLAAGGPAGGYCTLPCDVDEKCAALDALSVCVQIGVGSGKYCIRTCRSLDADLGEAKCLNRTDLVCVSKAADGDEPFDGQRQAGYCAARCGGDEECPPGRFCDAERGICTAERAPGAEIGARCTLDGDCSSRRCEERDAEGVGVCSALCVLGAVSGCGYGRAPASRDAACLTPLVSQGRFAEAAGDLGLCRELCDQASDCQRADEGWLCSPINASAVEYFGRSGACVPGRE